MFCQSVSLLNDFMSLIGMAFLCLNAGNPENLLTKCSQKPVFLLVNQDSCIKLQRFKLKLPPCISLAITRVLEAFLSCFPVVPLYAQKCTLINA